MHWSLNFKWTSLVVIPMPCHILLLCNIYWITKSALLAISQLCLITILSKGCLWFSNVHNDDEEEGGGGGVRGGGEEE